MHSVNLAKYQPKYYKNSDFTKSINTAIENELRRLLAVIDAILTEARVPTANVRISDWEKSVGLLPDAGFSLESRRSRVLARLRQLDTTTPERIAIIVKSYARGDVEIIENYADYSVIVKFVNVIGKPDNMAGIIEQINRIIPAHLAVSYEYKYRTWGEVLGGAASWREVAENGYTWRDLIEKEAL